MADRVVQVDCEGRGAGRVAFKVGRRRKDGIVDRTQFPSCLDSLAGIKITNKNERQLSKIINKTFFAQIQSEFPPKICRDVNHQFIHESNGRNEKTGN